MALNRVEQDLSPIETMLNCIQSQKATKMRFDSNIFARHNRLESISRATFIILSIKRYNPAKSLRDLAMEKCYLPLLHYFAMAISNFACQQ